MSGKYDIPTALIAAVEQAQKSQAQIAREAGTSPQQLSRLLSGERKLTKEWALRLAGPLGVRAQDLLFSARELKLVPLHEVERNEGIDGSDDGAPAADLVQHDFSSLGVSTIKPFQGELPGSSPDIDTSAGAGPGGLPLPSSVSAGEVVYSADAVRGEIVMPDYLLSEFTRARAPRVHWIKVRGDSMEPTLLSGERIMVDTTDTAIGQGGVFVLRDPDGEVIVKRLRKLKGGDVEVISDNPKQATDVHSADSIAVIGRVVGRLARL